MLLLGATLLALAAAPGYHEREVAQAARAAGFGDIAERVGHAARPTVLVRRTPLGRTPRRLGTSRLGGDPDLPAGRRWPTCDGKPLTFLAQVRVRDLPSQARDLRRHGGLFLVFTGVEFDRSSAFPIWAGACTTVVHARARTRLRRQLPPLGGSVVRVEPARMRFAVRPDVPDLSFDEETLGPPLQDVAIHPIDRQDAWFSFRQGLRGQPDPEHRLLGYADVPNGEGERCWERTRKAPGAWRHLITIGWDDAIGWAVADGGRLQVAISPSDLRRGRFGRRVCGLFDSG